MASRKAKRLPNDDLRGTILAAAQKILSHEGYAALSLRRLAAEIGYSATTVYLYFENRDEIIVELGRAGLATLEHSVRNDASEPIDRLRHFAEHYVAYGLKEPDLYRLMFMADSTVIDAMFRAGKSKDADNAGQRIFRDLVRCFEALPDGSLRPGLTPQRCAEVFWLSLHGIVSLKLSCGKFLRTSVEELVRATTRAVLTGLLESTTAATAS